MNDILFMKKMNGTTNICDYFLSLFLWKDLLFTPSLVEVTGLSHVLENEVEVIFIRETFVKVDNILMFNKMMNFNLSKDILL
jgi:hypothetical protein